MLYATGLVAGGSVGGVLIALVAFFGDSVLGMEKPTLLEKIDLGNVIPAYGAFKNDPVWGGILCAAAFGVLCWLLFRNARKTLEV
jgi:hypothetical protein